MPGFGKHQGRSRLKHSSVTRASPRTRSFHTELQKLAPRHIKHWHDALLKTGLAPRTIGHAHRLLHKALADALAVELVSRNVVSVISPPSVEHEEIEILSSGEIRDLDVGLRGHWLHPIFILGLASGLRRGELLALRWSDVDLDHFHVKVERSLEQTKAGLRFKVPKSRHGRRTVPDIPPWAISTIRAHQKRQLEHFMALGAGRPELVFTTIHAEMHKPNDVSRDWARVLRSKKLPRVSLHSLRHSCATTLLVADKLDVVTVSRRLGHRDASITLKTYAHAIDEARQKVVMAKLLG